MRIMINHTNGAEIDEILEGEAVFEALRGFMIVRFVVQYVVKAYLPCVAVCASFDYSDNDKISMPVWVGVWLF
jgi:hypothetical protein